MESSSCSRLLLLCDEELHLRSPSPLPPPRRSSISPSSPLPHHCSTITVEDRDTAFQSYQLREHSHAPRHGYHHHLLCSPNLSTARTRSVQWILQASSRLNLETGTTFYAVNYLDRFISINCCLNWEGWMVELLSIACLSIASKLNEVFLPSLHGFQMEDLEHSFEPRTIQQMEMTVLKALDWRLICVTPYSYTELLLSGLEYMDALLTSRITELLFCTLVDIKFLEYSALAVAESAIRCALHELCPQDSIAYLSIISRLMPEKHMVEMDTCHKIMEENVVCATTVPWKDRVPSRRAGILDCIAGSKQCFSEATWLHQEVKKRGRVEDVERSVHKRHQCWSGNPVYKILITPNPPGSGG